MMTKLLHLRVSVGPSSVLLEHHHNAMAFSLRMVQLRSLGIHHLLCLLHAALNEEHCARWGQHHSVLAHVSTSLAGPGGFCLTMTIAHLMCSTATL